MYIWLFSRSLGAGSATTRNTRGLTRSVIALIEPPFPAPSRPSNTMHTRRPSCTTHSWSFTSSPCSRLSSFSYSFRPRSSDRSSAGFPSRAFSVSLLAFFMDGLGALLGDRDRLAEQRHALDEERKPHGADHRELAPDPGQAAAPVDDHLGEAHKVTRRQEIRECLEPLRLALHRGVAAGEQLQHDDDQDDEQRELGHRARDRPQI